MSVKIASVFPDFCIIAFLVFARPVALVFKDNNAIILCHSELCSFLSMVEFTVGTIWPNIKEAKKTAEEYIFSREES